MKTHLETERTPAVVIAILVVINLILAIISHAAVTITPSSPSYNGEDYYNEEFDNQDKFYTDTPNIGQSFTTGSNAGGYSINSVSFQLNTTTGMNTDGSPKTQDLTFAIRLVEIGSDNTTTSTLHRETGHTIIGTTWAAGDWITVSFDDSVSLDGDTLYGIDLEMTNAGSWRNGIPYLRRQSSDVFSGGYRYQFADGDPNSITASTGQDMAFHVDMAAIPEPSVALMGVAGLALLLRRNRKVEA